MDITRIRNHREWGNAFKTRKQKRMYGANWNYTALELFCSLAERLDDTKHYIDHGLQEYDGIRELVHGKVYSDIFKQIIVLAASEFEIMSKALCSAKGVKPRG